MEEQNPPDINNVVSETYPKKSHKIVKYIAMGVFILLPFVGFYLGMEYQTTRYINTNRTTIINTNENEVSPTIPTPTTSVYDENNLTTPINSSDEWQVYTHEPFTNIPGWSDYTWVGFTLYYPPTWSITQSDRDESTGNLLLKISKEDGSYADIIQGFGEGGSCLFPDDNEYETFEGMGSKFTNYVQIDKTNDQFWRLAEYPTPDTLWTHNLCASSTGEKDTYYTNASNIGVSNIKLVDKIAVNEFTEMLERLELIYPTE